MAAAVTRPFAGNPHRFTLSLRCQAILKIRKRHCTLGASSRQPPSQPATDMYIYIKTPSSKRKKMALDEIRGEISGKSHRIKKLCDIFKPRRSIKTDYHVISNFLTVSVVSFRIFETRMNILSANRDPFRSFLVLFPLSLSSYHHEPRERWNFVSHSFAFVPT